MESIFIILGTALFAFALIKTLFGFLAWLFPEADDYYRTNLDNFFILLDESSLYDIGHRVLVRLFEGVRELFRRRYTAIGLFCVASFVLNITIFVFVTMDVINQYFWFSEWDFEELYDSIERTGWAIFLTLILLVGLLATLFDLLSLGVTFTLLGWASRSKKLSTLSAHLLLDIVVAIAACMWAYAILSLVIQFYYDELWQNVAIYATEATNSPEEQASDVARYLQPTLSATLNEVSGLWAVIIWMGISTALPTVIYLVVLIPVIALRATPKYVQAGISRIVYLITTDAQPVLKQIAVFASNIGGLIAAIAAYLRLPPG